MTTEAGPDSGSSTASEKTRAGTAAPDDERPAIDDPRYRERYWGSRYERPYDRRTV